MREVRWILRAPMEGVFLPADRFIEARTLPVKVHRPWAARQSGESASSATTHRDLGGGLGAARRAGLRGFTLIELLVVLSILTLLILLLMPVLASARASARTTECAANFRSINQALAAFAADTAGHFPKNRSVADEPDQHRTWRATLVRGRYLPGTTGSSSTLAGDTATAGGVGAVLEGAAESPWSCPAAPEPPMFEMIDGTSLCVDDVPANSAYNGEVAWEQYPLDSSEDNMLDRLVTPAGRTAILVETRSWWPDLRLESIKGRGRFPGDTREEAGYFGYWHPRAHLAWAMFDGSVAHASLADSLAESQWWGVEVTPQGYLQHIPEANR